MTLSNKISGSCRVRPDSNLVHQRSRRRGFHFGKPNHLSERRRGSCAGERFAYDSCGRLSEVEEDGVLKARYSYDAFGNRSTMDSDAGHVEYTYDECDRLLSERTEGGETHYSYDPCGRLVSIDGERGSHSYSYDDAGRLMDAETPKGAVSFKHDALGKRRKSKRAGRTERRACDPLRPYNDTTWVEGRAYLFDVSLSAAVEEDGSVLYVACDELGSPTHVFDENGTLLQAYSYDEFGVEKETHTERLIPFGFTGYEMDGTGMLFAQARQYDPRTGRFCSEDVVRGTVARPQTLNRYSYCQGNPVGLVDRDGREASSGNLLDQFDEFWGRVIVGSDKTLTRQDGPNGTYAEGYTHGGGEMFVWHIDGQSGNDTTTGFSINMPSIETPWGWAFGTSFNVSYPTNGDWVPEITSSVNITQDYTVTSGSFGFNQKGLITDFNTSEHTPNTIGYSGLRAGTKTNIADWGEVALAVSTVVAVVAIAAIIIDDATLIGVLDDPLIAPLLAWLASGGAAASAIGTRLVGVLSTPAMSTGVPAACAALR